MNETGHNESAATPRRKFDETHKRHVVDLALRGDRTVKTVITTWPIPSAACGPSTAPVVSWVELMAKFR